jgi:hypothetical protein
MLPKRPCKGPLPLFWTRVASGRRTPLAHFNHALQSYKRSASAMCEDLASYHLGHFARPDLCRRLGRLAEARDSYEKAFAWFGASWSVGSSRGAEELQ